MLWFRRAEFDRECWFHTDGSVRGGITWDEILDMSVPVPSIEEQNKIVSSYNDIEKRIKLKVTLPGFKQLVAKQVNPLTVVYLVMATLNTVNLLVPQAIILEMALLIRRKMKYMKLN